MKKKLAGLAILILMVPAVAWSGGGQESAEPIQVEEGFSGVQARGIAFQWMVEDGLLKVILRAPTTGWIAVGFDPTRRMRDANIIIGYVEEGKAFFRDDFGVAQTAHQPDEAGGGRDDIQDGAGEEADGFTQLSFAIPLDSGDSFDRPLEPGREYTVILAHGRNNSDAFSIIHAVRTSVKITL
jgi:hypothetical protein